MCLSRLCGNGMRCLLSLTDYKGKLAYLSYSLCLHVGRSDLLFIFCWPLNTWCLAPDDSARCLPANRAMKTSGVNEDSTVHIDICVWHACTLRPGHMGQIISITLDSVVIGPNRCLTVKTGDRNFVIRQLFKDLHWLHGYIFLISNLYFAVAVCQLLFYSFNETKWNMPTTMCALRHRL